MFAIRILHIPIFLPYYQPMVIPYAAGFYNDSNIVKKA